MDSFARARGWPDELLKLWWTRNAALKMPLYIRCRFEHLPFITSPSDRRFGMDPIPAESARITALIRKIGVTTFLVVPVHLPKGQVAMIVWAGRRRSYNIHNIVENIEGHLLAIGHHFMRIAIGSMDEQFRSNDEQSRLTLREWDCMRTIAQGYRETEIAQLMGISRTTVRFHLDNVVHKFGCKTKTQAVALLAQLGALGPIGQ
jgi:DNA-binding CsgD family transcriptional regulator